MKYLVVECHPGYAVVLDQQGRFLRVANQNFEVGQSVCSVVALQEAKNPVLSSRMLRNLAAVAACLCLLFLGGWQTLFPYGTVRIQINPDVQLTVNRMDYVIDITPMNADAEALLAGYEVGIRKVDQVMDALADRAREMGYLQDGGQVHVVVQSKHQDWQIATQERLIAELQLHTSGQIIITPEPKPDVDHNMDLDDDWDDDDDFDDDIDMDDDIDDDDMDDDIDDDDDDDIDDDNDGDIDDDDDDDDDTDSSVPTPAPAITLEQAKNIAFTDLGITEAQVSDPDYSLEEGIYEIEFVLDDMEYKYEIHAQTGTILEKENEPADPDEDTRH